MKMVDVVDGRSSRLREFDTFTENYMQNINIWVSVYPFCNIYFIIFINDMPLQPTFQHRLPCMCVYVLIHDILIRFPGGFRVSDVKNKWNYNVPIFLFAGGNNKHFLIYVFHQNIGVIRLNAQGI